MRRVELHPLIADIKHGRWLKVYNQITQDPKLMAMKLGDWTPLEYAANLRDDRMLLVFKNIIDENIESSIDLGSPSKLETFKMASHLLVEFGKIMELRANTIMLHGNRFSYGTDEFLRRFQSHEVSYRDNIEGDNSARVPLFFRELVNKWLANQTDIEALQQYLLQRCNELSQEYGIYNFEPYVWAVAEYVRLSTSKDYKKTDTKLREFMNSVIGFAEREILPRHIISKIIEKHYNSNSALNLSRVIDELCSFEYVEGNDCDQNRKRGLFNYTMKALNYFDETFEALQKKMTPILSFFDNDEKSIPRHLDLLHEIDHCMDKRMIQLSYGSKELYPDIKTHPELDTILTLEKRLDYLFDLPDGTCKVRYIANIPEPPRLPFVFDLPRPVVLPHIDEAWRPYVQKLSETITITFAQQPDPVKFKTLETLCMNSKDVHVRSHIRFEFTTFKHDIIQLKLYGDIREVLANVDGMLIRSKPNKKYNDPRCQISP